MKSASLRELHLNTSAIVAAVSDGETFVIQKRGMPVAELRPITLAPATRRLPNREALIRKLPKTLDSGLILEQDRV